MYFGFTSNTAHPTSILPVRGGGLLLPLMGESKRG